MESGGFDNQNTRRDNEHTARTNASTRVNVYATGPAERAQTQIRYIYIYTYIYIYIYITCIHPCIYIHVYTSMYAHSILCMRFCVYVNASMYIHPCIHIHVYTFMYIHPRVCTCNTFDHEITTHLALSHVFLLVTHLAAVPK